jgi:hypothetical protein
MRRERSNTGGAAPTAAPADGIMDSSLELLVGAGDVSKASNSRQSEFTQHKCLELKLPTGANMTTVSLLESETAMPAPQEDHCDEKSLAHGRNLSQWSKFRALDRSC